MTSDEIWELLNRPMKDALHDDEHFKTFVDELRAAGLSQNFTHYVHRFVSESIDNLQKSQPATPAPTYDTYSLADDDETWLNQVVK